MKAKHSKYIGAALGLIYGSLDGYDLNQMPEDAFSGTPNWFFIVGICMGLFVPPLSASINSLLKDSILIKPMKFINKYINLYFFIIAMCISIGVLGLLVMIINGYSRGVLVTCSFFLAGSIGFSIGYLIDGALGKKAEKNA